ncbi:MAG: PhnD/SsuA/transferrin family substrate-binding protein [Trueperaceae bacterium]|nr:PhnD/SsuA/transferrin family substrate-binding protein [Trueperaceae bacterium]
MRMLRSIALTAALAAASGALAQEPHTVRVGMQAVGTFSWVVHAMQYFGVDEEFGLDLQPTTYATKQATELALRSDEVDVVVDDFVGAVQMRERGVAVQTVYPYGKAVGGVVVPADSDIRAIEDLEGATVAAASLDDKSLLILRALTVSQYGFDPQTDGETLAAAPWLMTGLMDDGEIDAGIPYWHFVSRMTYAGEYRDVMMVTEMLERLGLRSDLPILVLVAREEADDVAVSRFVEAMIETTERMKADSMDGIWQSILDEELYSLPDTAAFPEVRARWEAGLPDGWTQDQIDGLSSLVERLVDIAGAELVGIDAIPADAFTTEYAPGN